MLDKHKVLQIMVNLIQNAHQACEHAKCADKWIKLRLERADNKIRFSVSDNGVGISEENQAKIFTHDFTARKAGHGFGLHCSALIANELGGSLRAHSDGIGKGAAFTLELPLISPKTGA